MGFPGRDRTGAGIPDAIDGGQVDRLRVGGAQLAGFAVLRQRRQIHRARLALELRDRVELAADLEDRREIRSEEHTSELQSLMRISYAVFCLKKKNTRHH